MSVKWKLFLILILSMFATAGAGVYLSQNQPFATSIDITHGQTQQVAATQISQNIATESERIHYKTIPLESINSNLQGSDPATLALNAFEDTASDVGTRKVEVVYPQRNQALVTITQISHSNNLVGAVKYRFEMTTFGRSLLITSPPVWQIVWAGSQVQCLSGNRSRKNFNQNCQPSYREISN
ncbi:MULTISPECIES: hypothetical protein [unclassified Tolypothrix]|uniref:hypothetical protein n=1 Tax=unclassified Tolypothrix TaxID=2649714 RepID=UPI0005EAB9E9|nr:MULTISPECIES: hypothetical protein [unclassified Tolypothrix]BAY94656.1 hypothetical protein NIES3275_67080 [Microchaete diplosiphon NIES-3275]EKE99120.1 hypothetical protein FDUTEX481_03313 [Tolypothrix sp. PCC 7601]MBE9086633.1 hypothetical protein [Tolypothrix sp. LEGE 11397]UYD28352.1 hypothetical protein HGR01_10110 [Tolypothrix sp. PCC 7712]UYD35772.1 hypothetical protein HG267_08465 [Tolypothrix sp. PCC 7601]